VPGDHDLNQVGDAIVIGLRNAAEPRQRHSQAILSCSARRPDNTQGLTKCPVALPPTVPVTSEETDQLRQKRKSGQP